MYPVTSLKPTNVLVAENKAAALRRAMSDKKKWSTTTSVPDKYVTSTKTTSRAHASPAQSENTPNYMRPTLASNAKNHSDVIVKTHDVSKKSKENEVIGMSETRKPKISSKLNVDSLDGNAEENVSSEHLPLNRTVEENRTKTSKADSNLKKIAALEQEFPKKAKSSAPWIPAGIAKGRTSMSERTSLGASSPNRFKNYALGCRELTVEKKHVFVRNTSNTKRDTVLKDGLQSKTTPLGKESRQGINQQKRLPGSDTKHTVSDAKQQIQTKKNATKLSNAVSKPKETYSDGETGTYVIHKNKNLMPNVLVKEKVPNTTLGLHKTKTLTNRKISKEEEQKNRSIAKRTATPKNIRVGQKPKQTGIQLSQKREGTGDSHTNNTKNMKKSLRFSVGRSVEEKTASLNKNVKETSEISYIESPSFESVQPHETSGDEGSQKPISMIEECNDEETASKGSGEIISDDSQDKNLQSLAVFNWVDLPEADLLTCAVLDEDASNTEQTKDTVEKAQFIDIDLFGPETNSEIVDKTNTTPESPKSETDECDSLNNSSQNTTLQKEKQIKFEPQAQSDSKPDLISEDKNEVDANPVSQHIPSDHETHPEPSYGKETSGKSPLKEQPVDTNVKHRRSKKSQNHENKSPEKERKRTDSNLSNRKKSSARGVTESRTNPKERPAMTKMVAPSTVPLTQKTPKPILPSTTNHVPTVDLQKSETRRQKPRTFTRNPKAPPQCIRTKSLAGFINSISSQKGIAPQKSAKLTPSSKAKPNVKPKSDNANKKKKKKGGKKKKGKATMPLQEKPKTDSKIEMFKEQFKLFAKVGDRRNTGRTISMLNTMRWLKQAGILDNRRVFQNDVEIFFIHFVRRRRTLTNLEFVKFLGTLCMNKGLDVETVVQSLLECGEPLDSYTDLMVAGIIASESANPEPLNTFAKPLAIAGLPDLKDYPYKSSTVVRQMRKAAKSERRPTSQIVAATDVTSEQPAIPFPIPQSDIFRGSASGEFFPNDSSSDGENKHCEIAWPTGSQSIVDSGEPLKRPDTKPERHDYDLRSRRQENAPLQHVTLSKGKQTTEEVKDRLQEMTHRQSPIIRGSSPQQVATYLQEADQKNLYDDEALAYMKNQFDGMYSLERISMSGEKSRGSPTPNPFVANKIAGKKKKKKKKSVRSSPNAKVKSNSVHRNDTRLHTPLPKPRSGTDNQYETASFTIGNFDESPFSGLEGTIASYYHQETPRRMHVREKRFDTLNQVESDSSTE